MISIIVIRWEKSVESLRDLTVTDSCEGRYHKVDTYQLETEYFMASEVELIIQTKSANKVNLHIYRRVAAKKNIRR